MLDITKLFGDVKFTSLEESIITYILNNIDNCMEDGIRGIAKKIYTSPSTIMRLSKKLGYNGFVELVYSLKLKLSTEDNNEFINVIENSNIFTTNYDNAIDDFIEWIENGNILVSGEGFSELVSKYMYMKLLVLGKKSVLSTFIDFDILFDNNVETIYSVMLISKSGEGSHCVKTCMLAKERNLKVISFTGNAQSTLAKNSDITFFIPDCEKLDNDNYYPNPFFGYCIETFEFIIHKYFLKYNIKQRMNYKNLE
ncbi:3-hexulose-6-phosphate isomerase [Clostridium puniceum]|uniref:3-hexulose-6-phosphate isomerase n=1 Tax=Clostridium puniceum TaxID=29367 RepID=A0A1S8T793_9CLOT|nr:MurR/RpiR family transcriptional regulator [Clostridium puniceum]OOM73461.1 3-hexulose-6-phosphate isomerase [Clostridium puniceum]